MRFFIVMLMLCASPVAVADGMVEFLDGVIFEAPPNATVLAGYGRIRNATGGPVRIFAASSPDFARVEFHRTSIEQGVMRMEKLGGFAVPVGGFIEFKRGGMHLMLFEPTRPLRAGNRVHVELSYAALKPIVATLEVRRALP